MLSPGNRSGAFFLKVMIATWNSFKNYLLKGLPILEKCFLQCRERRNAWNYSSSHRGHTQCFLFLLHNRILRACSFPYLFSFTAHIFPLTVVVMPSPIFIVVNVYQSSFQTDFEHNLLLKSFFMLISVNLMIQVCRVWARWMIEGCCCDCIVTVP